ncbi:MAG TPA: hypothetical protein VLD16_07870 [Gaiellaceae bacterium]|nr:hypothetical protein [Gaiellaceae bacterium]
MAAPAVRKTLLALTGVAIVAALATASTAKAGLLSTGSASYCDPTASQVFAPWGDSSYYARLFNGSFEGGSTGWNLSGGARIVSGNEPFFVGDADDSHSLLLPSGSSATSATVCFALADWHLRLFARNVGSTRGQLHVQVVVPSLLGVLSVLDGGTVSAGDTWQPSPRLALLLSNVTSLLGTKAVAFRFTPVGTGAAFQLDDVYLDPWKCT